MRRIVVVYVEACFSLWALLATEYFLIFQSCHMQFCATVVHFINVGVSRVEDRRNVMYCARWAVNAHVPVSPVSISGILFSSDAGAFVI